MIRLGNLDEIKAVVDKERELWRPWQPDAYVSWRVFQYLKNWEYEPIWDDFYFMGRPLVVNAFYPLDIKDWWRED